MAAGPEPSAPTPATAPPIVTIRFEVEAIGGERLSAQIRYRVAGGPTVSITATLPWASSDLTIPRSDVADLDAVVDSEARIQCTILAGLGSVGRRAADAEPRRCHKATTPDALIKP